MDFCCLPLWECVARSVLLWGGRVCAVGVWDARVDVFTRYQLVCIGENVCVCCVCVCCVLFVVLCVCVCVCCVVCVCE